MGDTSIIARRLKNGHVQYGWSGNGGYFKNVGNRLLWWYQSPKDVEYLFSLGETALIGQIGSENGGYGWFDTHSLTGEPFSEDSSSEKRYSMTEKCLMPSGSSTRFSAMKRTISPRAILQYTPF